MEVSNQFSILPPGGVIPPKGLNAAMEGLVREVLLKNPKDIFSFAAEYFEKLVEIRRKASIDESKEISNLVYMHKTYKFDLDENNEQEMQSSTENKPIESPLIRKEVEEIIEAEDIEDIMDEVEVIEKKIKKSIDIDLNEVNIINEDNGEDVMMNNEENNLEDIEISQIENNASDEQMINDDDSKDHIEDDVKNDLIQVDEANEPIPTNENDIVIIKSPEDTITIDHKESVDLAEENETIIISEDKIEDDIANEENNIENVDDDEDVKVENKSSEIVEQPEVNIETMPSLENNDVKTDDVEELNTELINDTEENDDDKINLEVEHLDVTIISPRLSESGTDENCEVIESVQTTVRNDFNSTINDEEMENMLNEDNETNTMLERTASMNGLGFSENFDDQYIEHMNTERIDDENDNLDTSRNIDSVQDNNEENKSKDSLDDDMKLNIDLQQQMDSNDYADNENGEESNIKKSFEKEDIVKTDDTVVIYDSNEDEQEKVNLIRATTLIQKMFRGFMVRSRLRNILKSKKSEQIAKDSEDDDIGPINLDRVPELIKANIEPLLYTVPEEKNGSNSTEEESSTFSSAATKIQAGVRGYLTRKYYQLNKTNNSSDTTAPSIGEDSKSFDEIASTLESNSSDDPVSKIIVATSSIIIEQLEHFEKLENKSLQMSSLDMSKDVNGNARTKKRLKREDAIQLHSPYSSDEASANKNSSGKVSEEDEPIGDLAQSIISEIITKTYSSVDADNVNEQQSNINEESESEKASEENKEVDNEEEEKLSSIDITVQDDMKEGEEEGHVENQLRKNESFVSDDGDVVIGSVKLSRPVSKMSEMTTEPKTDEENVADKETDAVLDNESDITETSLNLKEEEFNSNEIVDVPNDDVKLEESSNDENMDVSNKEESNAIESVEDIANENHVKSEEDSNNIENKDEESNNIENVEVADQEQIILVEESNNVENVDIGSKDEESDNIENKDEESSNIENVEVADEEEIILVEEGNNVENVDIGSKEEESNNIENVDVLNKDDLKLEEECITTENIVNDDVSKQEIIEVNNTESESKGLVHSGEFHDALLPTKIVRQSSSIKKD